MNRKETNVGRLERLLRVAGGGLLAVAGVVLLLATDLSWWTASAEIALVALGIDFVYTGLTGYCPLYHRLGWSTARRPGAGRTIQADGVAIERHRNGTTPAGGGELSGTARLRRR